MDCITLIMLAFLLPMTNECPFICQKRYQNVITDNILCHWRLQNKFSSVLTLTGEGKRTLMEILTVTLLLQNITVTLQNYIVLEGNSLNY